MLRIRLQRIGRRNNPSYRIVVIDSRVAAKKGKPVEVLGVYDTVRKTSSVDKDRALHWIAQGAQVSDTMHNIFVAGGVIQGKKRNVLPKKHPQKKEDSAAPETPAESSEASDAPEKENSEQPDAPETAPQEKEESAAPDTAPEEESSEPPAAPEKESSETPEQETEESKTPNPSGEG